MHLIKLEEINLHKAIWSAVGLSILVLIALCVSLFVPVFTFTPLRLEPDAERGLVRAEDLENREFYAKLEKVLEEFGVKHRVRGDGSVAVPLGVVLDEEMRWNYTTKAEDAAWVACQTGDEDDCVELVNRIAYGEPNTGVDPDPERAIMYYKMSCRRGHQRACLELARRTVDPKPRRELLGGACGKGQLAVACVELGRFHQEKGAWRDSDAIEWAFERACKLDEGYCDLAAVRRGRRMPEGRSFP